MQFRYLAWTLIFLWVAALPAQAELVFFSNGRSMSVKAHRVEGETLILTMRNGGEITCAPATISRITPDEVPYEEEGIRDLGLGIRFEDRSVRLQPDVDARYAQVIDKISAEQKIDPRLVRAVIQVESAYQQNARSPKGAVGLMQLMPSTARQYTSANPYDPVTNIEAGIKHLRTLLDRFPLALALAAYNAGEASVQRYGGIPPYPETQNYVARILQIVGR